MALGGGSEAPEAAHHSPMRATVLLHLHACAAVTSANFKDVALKDVPLKSLFPDDNPPPQPVRLGLWWRSQHASSHPAAASKQG